MSSPKAPPAPDYQSAAEATAAGNLKNIQWQTEANRPDIYTPFGSETWSNDGKNNWTQTVTLTPETQAALASQQKIQQNQSSLANTLQQQVAKTLSQPFNSPELSKYLNTVPGVNTTFTGFDASGNPVDTNAPQWSDENRQKAIDAAYQAQIGLVKPTWEQNNKGLDEKMRLQGLTPGTEAYNIAMQNQLRVQAQQENQISNQAVLTGDQIANSDYQSALAGYKAKLDGQGQQFGQDMAAYGADSSAQQLSNAAQQQKFAQQMGTYGATYEEAMQRYLQPLNSMNAVLTGQQVQSPSFQRGATAGVAQGADYLGAANLYGQYASGQAAADAASQNQTYGTVGTIAGAALMVY